MIFVTVGTQLPFDRLLRAVDTWAAEHPETEVRAQTGRLSAQGYRPRHMDCFSMLAPDRFDELFCTARLVVAHAGTGSLLKAAEHRTPILMMPRRGALGEHRNDHQMATAAHFGGLEGVNIVTEAHEVAASIDRLLASAPIPPVLPDFADPGLIATVRSVIFPTSKHCP